ncbi:MAG: hypothetical protein HGA31_03745 [Candidatus Moranbacteria bacterium]|nr:hypothetical protein [Candidatus Moranbacteria bacterium]
MSLSRDILATLAYYDALDQPLTAFEVWKHLIDAERDAGKPDSVSLGDVIAALDEKDLRERIILRDGFFMLSGREYLVGTRIRAEKVAVAKLRRVRRLAKVLRIVPFVRMIGITGSLAMKKGNSDSDWDFFVVVRAGRIWIGRTILTGVLHIVGKRRHGNRTKDRACLNYFITDDHLAIPTEDWFSANEYTFLVPIIGREAFRRFELKNRWIARFKPNFRPTEIMPVWFLRDSGNLSRARALLERIFDFDVLESWLRGWQKEKIRRNPKTRIEGGHIEATDQTLVFLPHPHGPEVYEKFRKSFGELRLRG